MRRQRERLRLLALGLFLAFGGGVPICLNAV